MLVDFLPPTLMLSMGELNSSRLIIDEGGHGGAVCVNPNVDNLEVSVAWFSPLMVIVHGDLSFINIQRSQAGEYVCVLTSNVTGQTASSSLQVIVHCKFSLPFIIVCLLFCLASLVMWVGLFQQPIHSCRSLLYPDPSLLKFLDLPLDMN